MRVKSSYCLHSPSSEELVYPPGIMSLSDSEDQRGRMDNSRVANPMTGVSGEGHAWSLMIHALLLSVVNQNRVSGPAFRHYR